MRSELTDGPRGRAYLALCGALVLISLFLVPTWPPHSIASADTGLLSTASLAVVWAIVAVAVAMFVNLAGLPTLAHAGLWGVGAYASGVTIVHLGIGFWPSLLFAAAVPALVALPVALISLRTAGVAFLVVTIAFTEFIVLVIANMSITDGTAGLSVIDTPSGIGPLHFDELSSQYYLFLAFLFVALFVYVLVTRSRFGARMRAIRDDERLARSLGFNVLVHQVVLFELTTVMVGIAGALLLVQQQAVTPDLFAAFQFIPIYLAIMVGGIATVAGPAVGAWIAQFLPEWIGSDDPNVSLLVYGAILVAAMLFLRKGVLGTVRAWVDRDPRTAPAPPGPAPVRRMPAAPAGGAAPALAAGETVLVAAGLKRWFGANRALDGVDLTIAAGEIRGVIGPNGSGKTTLLNCVSGFLPLSAGTIEYRGRELSGRSADSIARAGLVRTFQEPEVFASFTVGETCELAVEAARKRTGLNDRIPRTSGAMLSACGLEGFAELPVPALSHGQLRLLGVVTAIACRPHLLLLDEPAAGLAAADAGVLRDVLRRVRELGTTIVVVDHDMSFLLELCHRVTVLDGGRKLAEGDPGQISTDPAVIAAYLGESFAEARTDGHVEGAPVGA